MDFLATPLRRRVLFTCLYLSEGAPIGFIWLALPTRLRAGGVPLERITWLTAVLVLPWTLKFLWAPLIDVLRGRRWTVRHWIIAAQSVMGLALVPLLWLEPRSDFPLLAGLLLVHALAAATQDVAIDALCIAVTAPGERGQLNGWMQTGMLSGRAMMGGGALVLASRVGDAPVVALLIGLTTFSLLLVAMARLPAAARVAGRESLTERSRAMLAVTRTALGRRNTWLGLGFALLGGAAFKSLEVVYGPFLIDRGFQQETIGWFSAGPMIGLMIAGALLGGWLADRRSRPAFVAVALMFVLLSIAGLALHDLLGGQGRGSGLLWLLATVAFGIGLFTAASYALFMDLTFPSIAATQFSAFMGMTNGCESWSTYAVGRIATQWDYPAGMLAMCAASLLAFPLLWQMRDVGGPSGREYDV